MLNPRFDHNRMARLPRPPKTRMTMLSCRWFFPSGWNCDNFGQWAKLWIDDYLEGRWSQYHNQWCHQSSEEMTLCFKDDSCTNANLYCLIFLISYIGFELMTAAAKEPSWRCHRPLLGVWCLVIYCTFFGPFFWSTSSHKVNLSSFKMTVAYLPSCKRLKLPLAPSLCFNFFSLHVVWCLVISDSFQTPHSAECCIAIVQTVTHHFPAQHPFFQRATHTATVISSCSDLIMWGHH